MESPLNFFQKTVVAVSATLCLSNPAWAQNAGLSAQENNDRVKEAILAEVKTQGLENRPDIQNALELARQTVLIRAWEQSFVAGLNFTDEQRLKGHQALIAQLGTREYHLRHILVRDETAAKLLIEKIQSGTAMATLAAEHSLDASSKTQGGLTGWTNKLMLQPELRPWVDQLSPNKVHPQPIKTAVGWHIVELVQSRELKQPTADQTRPMVEQQLARQALAQKLEALRAASNTPKR